MGSQGSPSNCIFHVTGFKKFYGVNENPTQVLASMLEEYIEKKRSLPPNAKLGSVTVMETVGEGVLHTFQTLLDSAVVVSPTISTTTTTTTTTTDTVNISSDVDVKDKVIWVHMGVNSGASKFAIERKAVNEATFRCPDEMGWQPQRIPIIPADGDISHARETTLPATDIVELLAKKGFNVAVSNDAGRFVCNYVYYHSLHHSAANGTQCIFVHVPPFDRIDCEQQLEFIATLLETLATLA